MRWEKVFVVDSQLRPAWRFFLSAVMIALAYVGVAIILGLLFGALRRHPQLFTSLFWAHLLTLPALLGVFRILTKVFEGKPLASVGLAFRGRWKMELAIGLGLGAAMIFLVAGLERLLGLATFAWSGSPPGRALGAGLFFCFLLFVAAVNEEMTFRGYPFQRLVESIGPAGAVAVSSALFGLAHLGNPSHTWISTLNTMLVGVPLAVAYLRTRALWLPIGMHFAWNFFQGYGLGFPVSGIVFPEALARPHVRELAWLTGGKYGPEGSVLASTVIVIATIYLCFSKSIYITEEMRALVFGPAPSEGRVEVVAPPPTSTAQANAGQRDLN